MIYLITGNMGTGKTSMALTWVLDNKFELFEDAEGNKRPIFAVNIPNINKKVLPIADVSPEDFMAKPLHENFPEGAVIFVDEAMEIYPPRAASTKMPVHVEGLNTLRHYGLTLILITQNPAYLDPFVKGLISKHIHVERKQLGSRLYEWNHLQTSFSRATHQEAYSEIYKPDKRVFDLYKSSSKHIKFKKSLSWYWYALVILPFVVLGALYWAKSSYQNLGGQDVQQTPVVASAPAQSVASGVVATGLEKFAAKPALAASEPEKVIVGGDVNDYVPRVPSLPETAPIYDNLRNPVNMETVAGCVKSVSTCNCYTEQGTKVYASKEMCTYWAENGVFQRYRSVESVAQKLGT
jgi:hypothetical protein